MQGGAPGSLGKLVFPTRRVVGVRVQRSEESRGARQVALGLCDTAFIARVSMSSGVIFENLIKLSQRFGETTKMPYRKARAG